MELWNLSLYLVLIAGLCVGWVICSKVEYSIVTDALELTLRWWRTSRMRGLGDGIQEDPYNDITPMANFQWKDVDHLRLRPFKAIYHLTMGIQSITMSDLVLMDRTYKEKTQMRRQLINTQEDHVVGFHPVAADAVRELYLYLFGTYLPRRYPTMFRLKDRYDSKQHPGATAVRNVVFDEEISLIPPEPKECLRMIGRHVDNEFALLLPTSNPQAAPFRAEPEATVKEPYHLHAFVLTFPSGFDPAKKLGLPLAAIHGPVPGYSAKLEKSMDRFFATLPFGKIIWRSNWSISTDGELFKPGEHIDIRKEGNDACPSMGVPPKVEMTPATYEPTQSELDSWKEQSKKIDPAKCGLRMERQTLHRLEKTGAIVFAFKTLLEPLSELKKEGCGRKLADALNGLASGSVPAMDVYKDGVIWREPLVEYLTS